MDGMETKASVFLLVLLWTVWQCCGREFICEIPSDWTGIKLESRVYYADVVVYGMVLKHFALPGELQQYFPDSYGAEMEVFCTFKGGRLPRLINVTNIATTDCSFTRTQPYDLFVLLLHYNPDGQLEPYEPNMHSAALNPQDARITRTILSVCGTGISQPIGVQVNDSICLQTTQSPCISGAQRGTECVFQPLLAMAALVLVLQLCYVR